MSPGVDGAQCRGPSNATNGCSSAGRGPANSRSHTADPNPVTHANPASGYPNPTARAYAVRSGTTSRTASSPPSATVSTRNIAAELTGLTTGCAASAGASLGIRADHLRARRIHHPHHIRPECGGPPGTDGLTRLAD